MTTLSPVTHRYWEAPSLLSSGILDRLYAFHFPFSTYRIYLAPAYIPITHRYVFDSRRFRSLLILQRDHHIAWCTPYRLFDMFTLSHIVSWINSRGPNLPTPLVVISCWECRKLDLLSFEGIFMLIFKTTTQRLQSSKTTTAWLLALPFLTP